jgi:hypothetical protein
MSTELLQQASDELRRAGEQAPEDARERIHEQSNQLASLAVRERGPDHGRLARHMTALAEIADDLDGEAEDHVRRARDLVSEYREGVAGV